MVVVCNSLQGGLQALQKKEEGTSGARYVIVDQKKAPGQIACAALQATSGLGFAILLRIFSKRAKTSRDLSPTSQNADLLFLF